MINNKNKLWDDGKNTSTSIYKVIELDNQETEAFCTVFQDEGDARCFLKNRLEKIVSEKYGVQNFEWNWKEVKMDGVEITWLSDGGIYVENELDYWTFYIVEDELNLPCDKWNGSLYKVIEISDIHNYFPTRTFCDVFLDKGDAEKYMKNRFKEIALKRFNVNDPEWVKDNKEVKKGQVEIINKTDGIYIHNKIDYVTLTLQEDVIR